MSDLEDGVDEEQHTCRICLESNNLVQPCNCKTSYVHEECLHKWLNTSRRTNCEVCLFEYNFTLEKRQRPPILLFAHNPILNRNIIILGICGLFPISPFAFYMGFPPLDIYYFINILFVCIVFAYVRYVKVCQTLAFWKLSLTSGFTIVAVETDRYDHLIFDFGIGAIFLLVAFFCDSRYLRPINNEQESQNE